MQERLRELNWKQNQISIIDEDQGTSAKQAAGREGFQTLVADVGLSKIGIIMGYEVSRLARNCADWHRLLELCALFDTLIGDSDGIYNTRDFNDRLLLGLKGTMSEAELHSLRLRLDAGRLSKARRGALIQPLPTGLLRTADGQVVIDPDKSIAARIRLVFTKFQELGSGSKVLTYLVRNQLKLPRRQCSGLYAGEVIWKPPTLSVIHSMLKNPAYAGAFAYGRRQGDPTKQVPGRPATGRLRRNQKEWLAFVQDVYPAYISWRQFEANQRQIADNRQRMLQERFTRKGRSCIGAALLTGLVWCGNCGHKMQISYTENRFRYHCTKSTSELAKAACQSVSGHRIDDAVVQEFFRVLAPAQIDAMEQVTKQQTAHHREQLKHLQQEVARLEYAATRAERQYNHVDPENRLIASTLERRWEEALLELEITKSQLIEAEAATPQVISLPRDLREAFADAGRQLPELWPQLSIDAKRSLLSTLITQVNLLRDADGVVQIRIVWRGNLVTETRIQVPVHSLRYSQQEQRVADTIRQFAAQGATTKAIIAALNDDDDLHPCRAGSFTPQIVNKIKSRYSIVSNREHLRRGDVTISNCYTVAQMAEQLQIDPSWFYRKISCGAIRIRKDKTYGCYLIPKSRECLRQLDRLKRGTLAHVSIQTVHPSG